MRSERFTIVTSKGEALPTLDGHDALRDVIKKMRLHRYVDQAFNAFYDAGGAIICERGEGVGSTSYMVICRHGKLSDKAAGVARVRASDAAYSSYWLAEGEGLGCLSRPVEGASGLAVALRNAIGKAKGPARLRGFPKANERFVDEVNDALGQIGSEDLLSLDDVEVLLEARRKEFVEGEGIVIAHRMMRLPEGTEGLLEEGMALGCHWTTDSSVCSSDNLYDRDTHPDGLRVIFEGRVAPDTVDWPMTLAYNSLFPHENKLYLTGAVAISDIRVEEEVKLCSGFDDEGITSVRSDLYGKIFGTRRGADIPLPAKCMKPS